jgi:hypothetical protein
MLKYRIFKVHWFPDQMWLSMHYHKFFWVFMKKYRIFKVHWFARSDVRFNSLSCAFLSFYEISNFKSSLVFRFTCEIQVYFVRSHYFPWKISKFQISLFSISDLRFNALSCAFMRFHEKISNFQSSLVWQINIEFSRLIFSQFRCEILFLFVRFHYFPWKKIEISNFTGFPDQMWDSMHYHALSWDFMKKYRIFKVHWFDRSDLRLNALSCAFKKYQILKVHFFSVQIGDAMHFMPFHAFSWKNIELSKHWFPRSDVRFNTLSCGFMRFHEKILNF